MYESVPSLSAPHLTRARRLFARYFDPGDKGFDGFRDQRYLEEERNYKLRTVELARELLAEKPLRALLAAGDAEGVLQRARQVGQKSNLLYLAVPQSGDLAPLNRPLEPDQRLSLAQGVVELLHGQDEVADRVDRFLGLLTALGLPARWALFSYLLFFVHPADQIFIKPTVTARALDLLGLPDELAEAPSGRIYERLRRVCLALRRELADWQPADMIDIQSFLFISPLAFDRTSMLEPKMHRELRQLLDDFRKGYLETPQGEAHLAAYERDREIIRANFQEICEQERQGADITDLVLRRLLPYKDTRPNRDAGNLVSIAPVITKDLRQWFEGAGWAGDWAKAARAILRFYQRCDTDPTALEAAVREFQAEEVQGIQAGFLSPILAGLQPECFRISNNKPRKVLAHLLNRDYGQKLDQYPRYNRDLGDLLTWIGPDLMTLCGTPEQPAADLFDSFSHWLVGPRNYFKRKYWKIAPGEKAHDWDRQRTAGLIAIGWRDLGDLRQYESKEQLRQACLQHYPEEPNCDRTLWTFLTELKQGDIVIANRGKSQVVGIGVIKGDYRHNPGADHYVHERAVDWYDTAERSIPEQGSWMKTIVSVDRRLFLSLGLAEEEEVEVGESVGAVGEPSGPPYQPKPEEQVPRALPADPYVRFSSLFGEIAATLERKRQIILFGPPGTGKSFVARAFARQWVARRLFDKPFFHLTAAQQQAIEGRGQPAVRADAARAWWVCVNPDILSWDGFDKKQRVRFSRGRVASHFESAQPGDLVFGYQSAPVMKLMALARVSAVGVQEDGSPGPGIELEPMLLLSEDARLPWRELVALPGLEESEPIRQGCRGRLFALAPAEAAALVEQLRARTGELPEDLDELLPERSSLAAPRVEWVTFHPAFGYEEFMEALRPLAADDGKVRFEVRPGVLLSMAERARQNPREPFVLVIDEINRGNVARTFGELITLLERDKRDLTVTLPCSGRPFRLPDNLYIVGTMNTSDRSITQLDTALRRRFAFREMQPDPALLDVEIAGIKLSEAFAGLNRRIRRELGREKQIGHSFFLRSGEHGIGECPSDLAHVREVLRQEIVPLLLELCYEDMDQVRRILTDGVLDPSTLTLVEALAQDAPLVEVLRTWSQSP